MESEQPQRRDVDRRFLTRLAVEIEGWQGQGIITPEQGQEIIASYPVPPDLLASRRTHGRLVTILAILGSVLIGVGVILFFASQWGDIPRAGKLALILVAISAAYGIGYWLRYQRGYQRVGTAVILLAALFYGAGIHLVAQVYHVPVNDPNLFAYWFLGVLPLAYLTRSQPILVLAVGLFLAAVGFRLVPWLEGAVNAPLLVFALYLVLGLMLYSLGKLQAQFGRTRSYTRVYEILGLVTTFGPLYLLTFRSWFEGQPYKQWAMAGDIATGFWLLFYIATALALVAFAATVAFHSRRRLPWQTLLYEGAAALLLLVAVYSPLYLVAVFSALHLAVGSNLFYPIVFNFLLLLGLIGLVFVGYFRRQEVWINIALVFFSVDAVTRYFEFSWTLFDRSLVFVLAGVILLVGGFFLERGRRRMFERMRVQGVGHET